MVVTANNSAKRLPFTSIFFNFVIEFDYNHIDISILDISHLSLRISHMNSSLHLATTPHQALLYRFYPSNFCFTIRKGVAMEVGHHSSYQSTLQIIHLHSCIYSKNPLGKKSEKPSLNINKS